MSDVARRFSEVDVVVVGSINVDQVTYCARFPSDGETLVADRYVQGFGGKGANQAVMAARLGARVAMIGCLGDDDLGAAGLDNLVSAGVDVAGVARVPGIESGVAPIWVDETGTNRILIVPGANAEVGTDHIRRALDGRRGDVVLGQLETPQPATAAAFDWAHRIGAITVINAAPAARVERTVRDAADWLVVNESEFALLWGVEPDVDTVETVAASWGGGVVVTLGAAGALLAAGDEPAVAVTASHSDAVDTTGAGDAFVGTFAVGIAAGLLPADAVRAGCAAGALSVRRPGAQASFPTAADLIATADLPGP